MITALIEAGLAIAAALAATARGGRFLWWVWRHRGGYPPNTTRKTTT